MMGFSYAEFSTRNLGFINGAEQAQLKNARVFICGVGGMGGACIHTLARAGVSGFVIADMDVFEISNLNRQVFANLKTIGMEKTAATRAGILDINPDADIAVYGADWFAHIDEILAGVNVVVNGMDDVAASVQLYRKARAAGIVVIDAYAASLPSVYVTRPQDKTPEERLSYATHGKQPHQWTPQDIEQSFMCEIEYVMALSSSRHYIDLQMGAEMAAGKRKRMSYAPMVITTGNLMAYEALNVLLGKASGADNRGYFFNPYKGKTERPPPAPVVWVLMWVARRMIKKLLDAK